MSGVFSKMKTKKKKTANNHKNNNKKTKRVIITVERQPFVFQERARGKSYQGIANSIEEEFGDKITLFGVRDFLDRHKTEYDEYLQEIRDVRLANCKARILELQTKAEKLGLKIDDILETIPYSKWDRINISGLIKEFRGLLDQLSQESGDKVQKFQGLGDHKHFYFGDDAINKFADLTLKEREGKASTILRNRIKES